MSVDVHRHSTNVIDRLKLRGLWTQVNVNICKDTSPSLEIPEGRGIRTGCLDGLMFCIGARTGRWSLVYSSSR